MKRVLFVSFCVMLAVAASNAYGQAWDAFQNSRPVAPRVDEEDFFRFDASIVSRYVFRGMLINDDPVVQPQASFYLGPMSLSAWGNLDLSKENDSRGRFSEVRYIADFAFEIAEALQIYAGGIYYTYPNDTFVPNFPSQPREHDTWEAYAGATVDFFIRPSVTVFQDVKRANGTYVVGAAAFDLDLTDGLALQLSSSVGWGSRDYNEYYFNVNEKAFTDAAVTASLPIQIGEVFVLTPFATFTTIMDTQLKDIYDRDDNIVYGLMASLAF